MWTDLSSILSGITRVTDRRTDVQTDGRTDRQTDRILIARPRLHFMQRCKNPRIIQSINFFFSSRQNNKSIAFALQHGHRMWNWFVNFLDKKVKINFKTEYQFNTSV